MRHILLAAAAHCAFFSTATAQESDKELVYLDLQLVANQGLDGNFHDGREGNNLTGLPRGEQILADVKFKVGDRCVQLDSPVLREFEKDFPKKVEDIRLDRPIAKLHILHGTGYGGGPNEEGSPWFVRDGTVIGQYTVRYDDKSEEIIQIVYGEDVRDWWFSEKEKGVSRAKVAWIGDNELAKKYGMRLRLYVTTWANPKPDKKILGIDYSSTFETAAAPFCLAITAEAK